MPLSTTPSLLVDISSRENSIGTNIRIIHISTYTRVHGKHFCRWQTETHIRWKHYLHRRSLRSLGGYDKPWNKDARTWYTL